MLNCIKELTDKELDINKKERQFQKYQNISNVRDINNFDQLFARRVKKAKKDEIEVTEIKGTINA